MATMSLSEELRWRGLVFDETEGAKGHLDGAPIAAYIGFDPTAESLHVGSLLPIMILVHLQRHGHRAIALVGGATGMIGDPSGRSSERQLLDEAQLQRNVEGIRAQLGRFLNFEGAQAAKLVNNYDWCGGLSFIQVLRDVGKHFPLGMMLGKESVKRRISTGGISYTEFSYMLLQAYDFLHLSREEDCLLQLGGSDQWGNITAGIELIRRVTERRAHGLVMPLVTSSTGEKFGKSAEGAIWLDAARCSPFKFYQFWLNQGDEDALRYVKYFTLCSREDFEALEARHSAAPEQREAQRFLARDVTERVHGAEALARAERSTAALFGGDLLSLSAEELEEVFQGAPSAELPREEDAAPRLVDALVAVGMSSSKGEARRLIKGGGVSVNQQRVQDPQASLGDFEPVEGYLFILRRGSKQYFLLRWR